MKKPQYAVISLISGQTVLAEVLSQETDVVIKEPVSLVLQNTQQGTMMSFMPYLDYCEEYLTGISIKKEAVVSVSTPSEELVNMYEKAFGKTPNIQVVQDIPRM